MKAIKISLPVILLCILFSTSAFAGVYKKTNPDGSVTFSDVPPKKDASPIVLPPSSTYTPPPVPKAETSKKQVNKLVEYESIAITSPANDTAVRHNAGNLTIKFTVKPGLQPDHSYVLLMDGKVVGEGKSGAIQLKNVDRGSHTFIAQVVDANKETLIQSDSVLVHLQRAVVLP